ncbi:MAG: YicC family protein [Deltaproteobacteria bacterium]|nr:YicC family protein [Deltaproteobacteria bacterium]
MLNSMTGYGRGEATLGPESFSIELKSLNHRYLDINIRTPERFFPLDTRFREYIKKRFSRGAFSLYINPKGYGRAALRPNIALARAYVESARELKAALGLKGDVDVESLLKMKDIFVFPEGPNDAERDWKNISRGLNKACEGLSGMRKREGGELKKDIEKRLKNIHGLKEKIGKAVPAYLERYRERLKSEMAVLLGEGKSEDAIAAEAAIFAQRTDISEEIARLKSHTEQFRRYMGFREPVGRRLDFLCQEVIREANTIGSKSPGIKITQMVVEIKAELEKIREQVQNIE